MNKLSWRVLRDLGLMTIAGVVAVYIVAIVLQTRRIAAVDPINAVAPVAPIAPLPPPTPPLPPIAPQSGQGVHIYHSGSDAYSVTVGSSNGVTEITTRQLGGNFADATEFMELLKEREPEMYAWAKESLFRREARQIEEHNRHRSQHESEQRIAGLTDYGLPVKEGETIVVPLKPKRPQAEIDAQYTQFYEVVRSAYLQDLQRQEAIAAYEKRKAAQARSKDGAS